MIARQSISFWKLWIHQRTFQMPVRSDKLIIPPEKQYGNRGKKAGGRKIIFPFLVFGGIRKVICPLTITRYQRPAYQNGCDY